MNIPLTKVQVIAKLETDPLFILRFAVDNNPIGVVASLNANDVPTPNGTNGDVLYNQLLQILNTDKAKASKIIAETRYNPLVPINNYTYGLSDYLRSIQPATTVTAQQRFSVDALLGGLGAGLSAYTNVSASGNGAYGKAPSQLEIDAKKKADDEKKKKEQTQMIIWAVVGLVVISVIIYFSTKKKTSQTI